MKIKGSMLLFFVTFGAIEIAQTQQPAEVKQITDFRIDSSRPYVYLEIVSVGTRKPVDIDEPGFGIMLRLKNNCRLPIAIITFGSAAERAIGAYRVMDEVVLNPLKLAGDQPGIGATGVQQNQEGFTAIVTWPNQTEEELKAARTSLGGVNAPSPHGYSDQYVLGRKDLTIIPPGETASFSYPVSHLSNEWHLEIPFRLALTDVGSKRPPYSYVALFWSDLSDAERSKITTARKAQSEEPTGTANHEAGHPSGSSHP